MTSILRTCHRAAGAETLSQPSARYWFLGNDSFRGNTIMTYRTRDPERVRHDAIEVAIRKLRADCTDCADAYFEIARAHGATEVDIESARAKVAKESREFKRVTSRRDFIKVATLGAVGVAATGAPRPLRALIRDPMSPDVQASSPTAANTGWISAQNQLLALEPEGTLGPSIDRAGGSAVRALGGTLIVVGASENVGGQMNTSITLYSADSGSKQATVSGEIFDSGKAPEFWDAVALNVSPSGRLLAILHTTVRVRASGGTKSAPAPRIHDVVYGVEIIDLEAKASKAYISTPPESLLLPGAHVVWGRDDSQLYLFYLNAIGNGVGAKLAFDGSNLITEVMSVDPGTGAVLPNAGFAVPSAKVTRDGLGLVRFTAYSNVEFIDLTTMRLETQMGVPKVPIESSKPVPLATPLYDAAGTNLYLADCARGQVYVYDLEARSAVNTILIPVSDSSSSSPRLGWGYPGSTFRACLSPDGNQLLMVENRGSGTGLWSVDLLHGSVAVQFASGVPLGAVSFSPDGSSIFALSYEYQSAVTLTAAGRLVGATQLGQQVIEFVGLES